MGKYGCALGGIGVGQLNDRVDAVFHSRFSPFPFVDDGRFPALHEIAAHDRDQHVAAALRACLFHMIQMSVMQRIVFRCDSAYFHVCFLFAS